MYEEFLKLYGCSDFDMDSFRVAVIDSKKKLPSGVITRSLPYGLKEIVMAERHHDGNLRPVQIQNIDIFGQFQFLTLAEQKTREDVSILAIPVLPFLPSPYMFLVTTKMRTCGAGVLALPDVFSNLADKLESDLILLPESMHGVIAFSANAYNRDPEEALELVRTVNGDSNLIEQEDVLCNAVFLFRQETQEIEKIAGE